MMTLIGRHEIQPQPDTLKRKTSMEKQTIFSISQPDSLLIGSDSAQVFGCNQEWFTEKWQQRAGCGPCTAATILFYLSSRFPQLNCLYPPGNTSREGFTQFMADIWNYVTPGAAGVNEAAKLIDGVIRFAALCEINLEPVLFDVPRKWRRHRSLNDFLDFVSNGLAADSPVAFLNLSNGQLKNLDSWHWVTITVLTTPVANQENKYPKPPESGFGKPGHAIISDSGERKEIDLASWYKTSWLGGSAVWFRIVNP